MAQLYGERDSYWKAIKSRSASTAESAYTQRKEPIVRRTVLLVIVGAFLLALVSGAAVARTFDCNKSTCNGTKNNDTIRGDSSNQTFNGLGRNDTILGRGGDDDIFGNNGRDNLSGQGGDDDLFGGADNDSLNDNEPTNIDDTDSLDGGSGNDALNADDGDILDTLNGGQGNDTCRGDAGDTFVSCEVIYEDGVQQP